MSTNIKVQRVCRECGKLFQAQKTTTKYCSSICSGRARKRAIRLAKVEKSNTETAEVLTSRYQLLNQREFLSVVEACALLPISRWTIWRAIKRGELPAGKIGKRVLIRRKDLDSLFGSSGTNTTNPGSIQSNIRNESFIENSKISRDETIDINITECYTISEALIKYKIDGKTLRAAILRHKIPRIQMGRFTYIPKSAIDKVFELNGHKQ